MTSDIQLSGRDSVKLPFLKAILDGSVTLSVSLNGGTPQDYASSVHRDGGRVNVCGSFNFSEDPAGAMLTIRPAAVRDSLILTVTAAETFAGGKASVIRKSDKSVAGEFDILPGTSELTFTPKEQGFLLTFAADQVPHVSEPSADAAPSCNAWSTGLSDGGFAPLEAPSDAAPAITAPPPPPLNQAQTPAERLQTIENEYQTDQAAFAPELAELRARMEADESIIEYYKDHDITPTQNLLAEARQKLDEAEEQMRRFIEARQNKTVAIENEIKSNQRR